MLGLVITSFGIQKVMKSVLAKKIKKTSETELGENFGNWINEINELRNVNQWKAFLERLKEAHEKVNRFEYYEQFTLIMLEVKLMEEKEAAKV